ncbi:MAG: VCBS repeat-containing protein [Planctomycetes bacterium]|nr:VCBS repeat-containing protein [Planctomycetota bacterium]
MILLRQVSLALASTTLALFAPAQTSWRHESSSTGAIPAPQGAVQQTTCLTADFNRDGAEDVLVASRGYGGRVQAWLSQANGTWLRIDVDPNNVQSEAGGAVHDIDGDGDPDVVIGQDFAGAEIYWWENPYPSFAAPWTRRVVKSGGGTQHHDQAFGDVDGDGATELVAWNQNAQELLLFEIPSQPSSTSQPWPSRVIYRASSVQFEGLAIGDVDLDGVADIVGAGRWWKHLGNGAFQENVVDAAMNFSRAEVGQLVAGGRPELVFVPGDASGNGFWYEWNGSAWLSRPLGYVAHGHTLDIADLDGDGAQDLFLGEMRLGGASCRVRVLYGDGAGNFTEQVLATGNDIHEGRLADLDGDGDLDVAHKPYNDGTPRLDLWWNDRLTLPLDRWQRHLVDGALPYRPVFVGSGDFDNDGLVDLVAGGWWWKNPGTLAGAWTRFEINPGAYLDYATSFDIDGDGDSDLLGTRAPGSQANGQLAWAENRGAAGFLIHTNIASAQGDFLQGVHVQRFAGPSSAREVALSWHDPSVGVQMLTVPANPAANTWTWRRIQPLSLGEELSSGDLDGDGDLDLVLGTTWLENPSWTPRALGGVSDLPGFGGTPEPDRNRVVDLDGDGDLDVAMGLENGREVVWFENPRPAGNPTGTWTRRILGSFEGQGFSLDAADFDRDGDIDLVLGEHRGASTNRVVLLRNDATLQSWPTVIVDAQPSNVIDHHDGTQAIDLDRDGDLDLVSIGWTNPKLWIFENRARTGGGQTPIAQAPGIDTQGSAFQVGRVVSIYPAFRGQELRYTLDGSAPTASSPLYIGPLALFDTTQLRARAFEPGKLPSEIVRADFARLPAPLSLWHFDEGSGTQALDSGPRGNHGTVNGASWAPGLVNGALDFAPTGTRVSAGNFDLTPNAMTISAWIQSDGFAHLANGDARILSKSLSTAEQDHVFMLSTLAVGAEIRPRFRLKLNGLTHTLIAAQGNISASAWTHVAAVYDGTALVLYLDGEMVGRAAAAGSIDANPQLPVWIGDNPISGSRPFDGRIDEVRVDGVALSAEQVRALAHEVPLRGVRAYGYSSPLCAGTSSGVGLEALREAHPGDAFFGLGAWNPWPGLPVLVALGSAPSGGGFLVDQAPLWLDPSAPDFRVLVLPSDGLGRALLALPVPWVPSGAVLHAQAFGLNAPSCHAAQGLFASGPGLRIAIQ